MSKYIILPIFLLCCFVSSVHAQDLGFVKGEYLISVDSKRDASIVQKHFAGIGGQKSIPSLKQIAFQPMHVYLLNFDTLVWEDLEISEALHSLSVVNHFQRNKVLSLRTTPDDPLFPNQWQYINTGQGGGTPGVDIDMDLAWDITTGGVTAQGDTIVICVVDDGIDPAHEDMAENIWFNKGEIPNDGIDNDENGYVDDYLGWNVEAQNDNISGNGSHGTPVAGIVGAKGNNGIGVAGVNWNVKLMIVDYGRTTEANAIGSYAYAYTMRKMYNETNGEKGAFVVATNSSWGIDRGRPEDAPLWCAFYDALGEVGILSCGATANAPFNVDIIGDLPTACESDYLISVTNLNRNGGKVSAAGFGRKTIDLGAFGEGTYTVRTQNRYGSFGGTSGATPHVAGVIGLIYASPCPSIIQLAKSNPADAALLIKNIILDNTVETPSLRDLTTTNGRLNAFRALNAANTLCTDCSKEIIVRHDAEGARDQKINIISQSTNAEVFIRYRPENVIAWDTIPLEGNEVVLKDLRLCTFYEYQIAVVCPDSITSLRFGFSRYFESSGCCTIPSIQFETTEDSINIQPVGLSDGEWIKMEYRVLGTNDWLITNFNQYTNLANLENCAIYEYRLSKSCTIYDVNSSTTDVQTFVGPCGSCSSSSFCPIVNVENVDEWIARVKIGDLDHESGAEPNSYAIRLSSDLPKFYPYGTYNFELVPGFASNVFAEYWRIYLDLNGDGVFSNDELLYDNEEGSREPIKGTIEIPANAKPGISRLRVLMSFDRLVGPCSSSTYRYGETEDFCVEIGENQRPCPPVTTLAVLDSTQTSAIIQLGESEEGTQGFVIQYREKNMGNFLEITSENNIINLSNLSFCTTYEAIAIRTCEVINSTPSARFEFETSCINSVNESLQTKLSWYPNPTQNIITASYIDQSPVQYEIISTDGQKILKGQLVSKGDVLSVSVDQLIPGVYVIIVQTQFGTTASRFVKL